MEQQRLQQLIDKVLNGKASPQEQQELDQWYASQDENKGLTDDLDTQGKNALGSKLFRSIEEKIQPDETAEETAPVYPMPARNTRSWWMAAAVLLLIAAGGIYFFNNRQQAPALAAVWKDYETKTEVKAIRLSDGSRVWLNADSKLRYDTAFSNGKREVWLQGEAWFDVAHDAGKQFLVYTGNITTAVVGTSFNIDAYDTVHAITVTVKSGKVAVNDAAKMQVQLQPGQRLICEADGRYKLDSVVAEDTRAWTSGQLIFRDMKFSEVAKRLERKFGVQLIFRDASIGNCAITASFAANTPLKDILEMLALINGSEIKTDGSAGQYFISGRKQCK